MAPLLGNIRPSGRPSTHLVYSDRTMNLWLVETATGKQTSSDKATAEEISDYSWSPDGDWIAYSKSGPNYQSALWVYQLSTGQKHQLTDEIYSDNNPLFSRDGNYIFFLSNRDFNLSFSSFEFDYLYNNATKIYALPLRDDGTTLAPYHEDVEPYGNDEQNGEKENDQKDLSKQNKVTIDLEDIHHRVQALPIEAGSYRLIGTVKEGLLFASGNKISRYNIKEEKIEDILDGANNGFWLPMGNHLSTGRASITR